MKTNLSLIYLEKIQDSEKLDKSTKEKVGILLAAINDWPTPQYTFQDYENEISKFLGKEVSGKSLKEYLISNIDYSKDAWPAESLSNLVEIYNYYDENKLFKEILDDVEQTVNMVP